MLVGSLDKDGARLGVLDSLDEGVLIFAQGVFVDFVSVAEISFGEVFNGVDTGTTASKNDSFHVSSLGSSQRDDVLLGEHVQADGVDTLLIENDERLVRISADLALQVNDLLASLVGEATFRKHELLSVSSVRVEESRVDFGLLVFEGNVAVKNVAVLELLRHVSVTSTVIEDETLHQSSVGRQLVDHVHGFNHVQINWAVSLLDAQHSIDDDLDQSELIKDNSKNH